MSGMLDNLLRVYKNNPNDPFVQYGIAIEYTHLNDLDKALEFFSSVHENFPEYVPNYFHYGQTLANADQESRALEILKLGITKAQASGDAHAASELQGLYSQLELDIE